MVKEDILPSPCERFYQCRKCRKTLGFHERPPHLHTCCEWKCRNCKEYYTGQHLCFQRQYKIDPESRNKKFIFYDFETRQDEIYHCSQGYQPRRLRCRHCAGSQNQCSNCRQCQNCHDPSCGLLQHIINFVVMQTTCNQCEMKELTPDSKCSNCGIRCSQCSKMKNSKFVIPPCPNTCGTRELLFKGNDSIKGFCSYITQKHCKNSILVAHNAKSFDLYPILETLIDYHSILPDKIIYSGSKVMYMHVARQLNLTFLDSLNFLPMKLAKIPDAFGLQELCKGYFPHFFNTKANQNYVGPFPALEYYGYEMMSSKDRKLLSDWHRQQSGKVFNFQDEILRYCRSDVDILRQGCLEFRKTMIDATTLKMQIVQPDESCETSMTGGVDPFDYITIAGACMGIYKTLFFTEHREVEITRGTECAWYAVRCNESIDGVCIDGSWTALLDLKKDKDFLISRTKITSPIAVVPSNGYTCKDNFSKVSIQWLEWLMEKNKLKGIPLFIHHTLNGGEYRVPGTNYRCDGYSKDESGKQTIYEFYGNFFFTHNKSVCKPAPLLNGGEGRGRHSKLDI